jgi:hypothetical protein
VRNPLDENEILSLRGNKSIKAVFDSQVVRLDVIAWRVVSLDVRGSRVDVLDVFSAIAKVVRAGWMLA